MSSIQEFVMKLSLLFTFLLFTFYVQTNNPSVRRGMRVQVGPEKTDAHVVYLLFATSTSCPLNVFTVCRDKNT